MCAFVTLAGCSSGKSDHPATALPPTGTTSDPVTVVPPPSTSAVSPTATASASPTSSPQPAKPVLPAAAQEDTEAGASAVARFWHEALGYAFQTGDTSPLKSVAGAGCEACQNYSSGIDAEVAKGMKYRSDPSPVVGVQMIKFAATNATVRIAVSAGQVRVYNPRTRTTQLGSKASHVVDDVYLSWEATRWTVRHVYLDRK